MACFNKKLQENKQQNQVHIHMELMIDKVLYPFVQEHCLNAIVDAFYNLQIIDTCRDKHLSSNLSLKIITLLNSLITSVINEPKIKYFDLWMVFSVTIRLRSILRTTKKSHLYILRPHSLIRRCILDLKCQGQFLPGHAKYDLDIFSSRIGDLTIILVTIISTT